MKIPKLWAPWTDMNGDVSFTKLVITALIVRVMQEHPFPTITVIALLAAAFGKSTFEKWLSTKVTTPETPSDMGHG
jgi:hypothetical protein